MLTHHNPNTVIAPASNYSQAVAAPADARWLYISGQVGASADGVLGEGTEAQMEQCWANILSILDDAGMGKENLVKVTAFLINTDDIVSYREVRDRMLGNQHTASSLFVVKALANPDWTVEIEAIAAG
jgi:2-iminobutanoate/2-iminopropanoate deaminase